jgi:hypothetical protein
MAAAAAYADFSYWWQRLLINQHHRFKAAVTQLQLRHCLGLQV